ncbi:GGDEF domain-containing protein [Streptomyces sp. PR69]|uniref:GGDEF domain-containing protein n=1 Tax=Streptomyces sp. PR69 TaxID=2984950 RepID=UPI002263E34D|nr:GGDEF domain-containing protein [Streptomyces sp. PR69]
MSHTLTALSAALPVVAGWSVHSVRLRRRIEAARRDPLTGLWTRDAFAERACALLARSRTHLVCVVDLDGFKQVNDTLGHAAGDAVLRTVGQRLAAWAKDRRGVAGRLGGDEFAAVTPTHGDRPGAVLADLLEALQEPVVFDSRSIEVRASVGAARSRSASPEGLPLLLRLADERMYEAKQDGSGWCLAPRNACAPALGTVNGRRAGRPGTAGGAEATS